MENYDGCLRVINQLTRQKNCLLDGERAIVVENYVRKTFFLDHDSSTLGRIDFVPGDFDLGHVGDAL